MPDVPPEILVPRRTWADPAAYDAQARKLARMFRENFEQYRSRRLGRRGRPPGRNSGER